MSSLLSFPMTTSHKSLRVSTLMRGLQKQQQLLLRPNQRHSKHNMSPRSPLASLRLGGLLKASRSPTNQLCLIILLLTIVQATVRCQDFEDLNSQNNNNNNNKPGGNAGGNLQFSPLQQIQQNFQASRQGPQSTFSSSPSVSQSSSQFQPQAAPQQQANSRQSTFQRPVLSTRFASSSSSQQQQTMTSQQQQQQQQQQQPSNIEQIMKNALTRTSRMEQSAGPEARQDMAQEPIQSRSGAQFQPGQAQAAAGTPAAPPPPQQPNQTGRQEQASSRSSSASDKSADSSEALASTQPAEEFAGDKQTTSGGDQAVNFNNGHETNFTDARFANLFARRNNLKRVKFTPMEQVKAKPTLPSFIKSPPDPKQFNRNGQLDSDVKPLTQASTNLVSARLQQQPGQRAQLSGQVNKNRANAGITSNTAAAANNKRAQAQKPLAGASASPSKAATGSSSSKATATPAGPSTSRPVSNNPFNKSQQQNSDQASVIAMARRRLLANNALKEQQQKATTTSS